MFIILLLQNPPKAAQITPPDRKGHGAALEASIAEFLTVSNKSYAV